MYYKDFRRSVELALAMEGQELTGLIKDYTNDSIKEFCRERNWRFVVFAEEITLDGSEVYDLSSLLVHGFLWEVALQDSSGREFDKYLYTDYRQLPSKSYAWAMLGRKLYVTGDSGTLTLIFVSAGRTPTSDAITAVDAPNKEFTIAGDRTDYYAAGEPIVVSGSTGNDNNGVPYTIASVTLSGGNTEIVVSETVADTTADGTIYPQYRYPIDGDYNKCEALDDYNDILKRMVVVTVLEHINDQESLAKEKGFLEEKREKLRRHEARASNEGQPQYVVRP